MLAYTESAGALWVAMGLILGMFFCWQFIAPKIRQASEELEAATLSEFINKRFQDEAQRVQRLTSLIVTFYLALYITAGLIGMGNLFQTLFQIDYAMGIAICIFFMLLYTLIGGFIAVAWTDFFQAVFLLVALGIVVISVYKQTDLAFSFEGLLGPMTAPAAEQRNYWHHLITTLSWGLGYMGMPHILNKFMSISEKSHMHRAKWLGLTWQTFSLGLAFCIGELGHNFPMRHCQTTSSSSLKWSKQHSPFFLESFSARCSQQRFRQWTHRYGSIFSEISVVVLTSENKNRVGLHLAFSAIVALFAQDLS